MDLALYARVIWRFKLIVVAGLLLAIVLATLSVARIRIVNGRPHLTYRTAETYQSSRTVLFTQKGFPWGNLNFSNSTAGRLASLPAFYAQLVNSPPILLKLGLNPDKQGILSARPVVDATTGYGVSLPLLSISALSTSGAGAVALAGRATKAFISYIEEQQRTADIPDSSRVLLSVVNGPQPAVVVAPRKKTLPIMIFVVVLAATLAVAFVLENLRPAVRLVPGAPREEHPAKVHPALEARAGE